MITKGPWKWHKRKHSNTHFLANEAEANDDFAIIDDGSAYGEYGAVIDVNGGNAKLIAAAPELLESLQLILSSAYEIEHDFYGIPGGEDFDISQVIKDAQSAINKALGE